MSPFIAQIVIITIFSCTHFAIFYIYIRCILLAWRNNDMTFMHHSEVKGRGTGNMSVFFITQSIYDLDFSHFHSDTVDDTITWHFI